MRLAQPVLIYNKCMTQLKISDKKTHPHAATYTLSFTHTHTHTTLFPCTKTLFIPHVNSDLGSVGLGDVSEYPSQEFTDLRSEFCRISSFRQSS